MIKKLKPCPFCNGKAEIHKVGTYKELYTCFCSSCGKTSVNYSEARSSSKAAIKVWNRRLEMVGDNNERIHKQN